MEENEEVKEESKVIINERVDGMLKEVEGLLGRALPVKQGAEFINEVLYAPISEETKEKVIEEILRNMKERINGEAISESV